MDTIGFKTTWGWMKVTYSPQGIMRVLLPTDEPHEEQGCVPDYIAEFIAQCQQYFSGEINQFNNYPMYFEHLPRFTRAVLGECANIPYGSMVTYGQLAWRVGSPKAARAVGQVMANNPLPLLIPCHRVIGSQGKLTGFGGGLELKEKLLRLEGALVDEQAHPIGNDQKGSPSITKNSQPKS